ncbi:hypothetical protein FRC08_013528 [Ceratobasidium sp. 394]|nr:hypothetical protein FRC08_013528 [Ceratobasidium sp. 394]
MHIALLRLSENYATRLRKMPTRSEVARRLPVTWDTHDSSVPHPIQPQADKPSVIDRLAELSHPDAEFVAPYLAAPWDHPHPFGSRIAVSCPPANCTRDERKGYVRAVSERIHSDYQSGSVLACYTDGSKRIVNGCRKVGVGFCILRKKEEVQAAKRSIGPRADIYDAEMSALALAAHAACTLATQSSTHEIHFYTDNQAALKEVCNLRPHPGQYASILFRKAVDQYLNADNSNSIQIHWVPGHAGIPGNERADQLASEATSLKPTPFFNRTITWARARAKERAVNVWA